MAFPLPPAAKRETNWQRRSPGRRRFESHLVSALSSFEAQGVKAPDSKNGERVERQNRNRPEAAEGGVCVAQQAHQRSGTCAKSGENFDFKFGFKMRGIHVKSMEGH